MPENKENIKDKDTLKKEVGEYIDKYYIPARDDITMDKEMKSIFDRISNFRKKKAESKANKEVAEPDVNDYRIDESAVAEFDASSMKKYKVTSTMAATMPTNRKIDDLMYQLEETFSQRLLRMIDERGMTDAESLRLFDSALLDDYKKVCDEVERLYKNWFLGGLSENWTKVSESDFNEYGFINDVPKQEKFYESYIENENYRVFVIISDAFRYEVAVQFANKIRKDLRAKVDIMSMQSVFPSITKFGMPYNK